jgi:hypothetical protein
MPGRRRSNTTLALIFLWSPLLLATILLPAARAQNSASPSASTPSASGPMAVPTTAPATGLPRGKKLILKDGTFQLVREYKVDGDRLRYYSLDSSQWEEMPASYVDWDATKKVEAEEMQRDAAIAAKARKQEAARQFETLDIDASLEAAPGIFLPPGEGLFIYSGQTILKLNQAQTDSKVSKGRVLEKVLVPIPVIPTRHNVSIDGEHAAIHTGSAEPEFYMRVADGRAPELRLIHTKIKGGSRQVEHIDTLMTDNAETAETVGMQRWQIANGVYRFTLSRALDPGEYVVAESVSTEGLSLYVWDFGVRGNAAPPAAKAK